MNDDATWGLVVLLYLLGSTIVAIFFGKWLDSGDD